MTTILIPAILDFFISPKHQQPRSQSLSFSRPTLYGKRCLMRGLPYFDVHLTPSYKGLLPYTQFEMSAQGAYLTYGKWRHTLFLIIVSLPSSVCFGWLRR